MKVLLGIDSSLASNYVVNEAERRPWPSGTIFRILNVVDPMGLGRIPTLLEDAKRAAQSLVKAAAEKLAASGHKVTTEVLAGFPRKEVVACAKEWEADLLLVGSHGQGAVKRFLMGSVAQAVLRTAPCSIEIVRRRVDDSGSGARAMKILLATDGSKCSTVAVKSVAARPWPAGSSIKVMSVIELLVPEDPLAASTLASIYPASLLEKQMEEAGERAREAAAGALEILKAAGLNAEASEKAPTGDPRIVLLDEAKNWQADLIVVGSHGWRGVDRLLMGSVSESVALHAPCSVEVIHA
jgi:nucleotide-binding universal stress UspA family protein